ncbi:MULTISPECIES: hypothetical protein [Variovorax]|uniref:hypothetical protein n=1 Tax=Variovorax TaxID=34072 RepID=UPI00285BC875|nr:hypothetical protein [Variovorax sp. 3319]MDR6890666.1 hypothetical protein [Variovorax sp. 3319]
MATVLPAPPAPPYEHGTGRPSPTLRGDFSEIKPMRKQLRRCSEEVEQEARQNSTGKWAPSPAARAQAVRECEATNAIWEEANREEIARVQRQNASRAADLAKARVDLQAAQTNFEAEEHEVHRLVERWLTRIDSSFRPDGLMLLADNPHLLKGATIAGPFRLLERRSADSAIATSGNAYIRIEKIPPELPLFSDRPFVMIARVKEVESPDPKSAFRSKPMAVVEWSDGGDCALATGSAGPRAGLGCLPWKGLQRSLHAASHVQRP